MITKKKQKTKKTHKKPRANELRKTALLISKVYYLICISQYFKHVKKIGEFVKHEDENLTEIVGVNNGETVGRRMTH